MPTQNSSSAEAKLPEWLDPFPEPHTLPNGWDLDSIMLPLDPPALERTDAPVEDTHG